MIIMSPQNPVSEPSPPPPPSSRRRARKPKISKRSCGRKGSFNLPIGRLAIPGDQAGTSPRPGSRSEPGRVAPQAPEGRERPGTWGRHGGRSPECASRADWALGSGPRGALDALRPGPRRIRGGPTRRAGEHGEEGQHGRRPAQGQPGGTPRSGRAALLRLVGDVPASPSSPRLAPHPGLRASRRRSPGGQTPC